MIDFLPDPDSDPVDFLPDPDSDPVDIGLGVGVDGSGIIRVVDAPGVTPLQVAIHALYDSERGRFIASTVRIVANGHHDITGTDIRSLPLRKFIRKGLEKAHAYYWIGGGMGLRDSSPGQGC